MAINNLTNTTWKLNDALDLPKGYGVFYVNFNFTYSDGRIYEEYDPNIQSIDIGYTDGYDSDPDCICFTGRRVYPEGGTIIFTGGDDISNPSLISWLETNATQVIEELSSKETYFSIMSELAQTIAEKTGAELPLSIDEMIDALAPKKYTVTVKAYMENMGANIFQTSLSANEELLYVTDSTKLYHNGTEITSKEYVLSDVKEVTISRYQGSFGAYRIDNGGTIFLDNGIFGGLDVNSVTIPITKDTVIYIGGGD